jgi:tRNA-Thr(GGU) m(6)t(6)A37 methyltransferase TsaA
MGNGAHPIKPIGRIRSPLKTKFGVPRQSGVIEVLKGEILMEAEYRHPDYFRGLEEFSHIWILWQFSKALGHRVSPTVRPPRFGGSRRVGVFASRSPFRPNCIGLSCVRLDRIEIHSELGPILHISGADLADDTPIYDIKPYLPYTDSRPDAVGGYTEKLNDLNLKVSFPKHLMEGIPESQRALLLEILSHDPRPAYQKDPDRIYGLEFDGFDIRFSVSDRSLDVKEVNAMSHECGYSCGCHGARNTNGSCGRHGHSGESNCVSLVPIFNHLPTEQMEEIRKVAVTRSFRKGESIYRAGDPSDTLYILGSGRVRIFRLSESGKEQLLRIMKPGDFMGELALFSESIHEEFAEAMEPTEMCILKRDSFQKILMEYPTVSLRMLSEFSRRLEESEKKTARIAAETVETRIALYLLDLYSESGEKPRVALPMSKKDLASYLGTTPETISRRLADMEDSGLIRQHTNKSIEILDPDGLSLI